MNKPEVWWGMRHLYSFKVQRHKIFTDYKGEIG